MARSCEPPADEWPVRPSGMSVTTEARSSSGVQDQRSTDRLASVTIAASTAVQRHAEAVLIRPATDQICTGLRWSSRRWPDTSDTVSGTSRAAHTAHAPDATVPSLSARYPPASRTPVGCGGTMNAANRNDPTASTAAISPAARTNGSPSVVAGPGSGRPVAVSASASERAPMPAAVQPASTPTPISTGHIGVRRLGGATPGAAAVDSPAASPAARATVMYPGYGRAPSTTGPGCPGRPGAPWPRGRRTDCGRSGRCDRSRAGCRAAPGETRCVVRRGPRRAR
ncbi:hypothetical protein BN971_01902 [Mycobacterium bohemicum DSM 44277]|uniref:Uncharacterized protein n=1 Tax=Mycobacterium bohemicum DSM 44277 TaxID=1236609 RepID=A0A0U0W6W5_MYCBE|nr:hypothetical protein BN971_01902 [Mycobacterium bohemicum DSM 44277]